MRTSRGAVVVAPGPPESQEPCLDPTERGGQRRLCHRHTTTTATWRCERCRKTSCDDCVKRYESPETVAASCDCGARCVPYAVESRVTRQVAEREDFVGAFMHPLEGAGPAVLASGAFSLFMVHLLTRFVPVLGDGLFDFVLLFAQGFLLVFGLDACRRSAVFPERSLDWPEINGPMSFVGPLFRATSAMAVTVGPGLALATWGGLFESPRLATVGSAVAVLGFVLLPAAWLGAAVRGTLADLYPGAWWSTIRASGAEYWRVVAVVTGLLVVGLSCVRVASAVPLLGVPLTAAVATYGMAVSMRLLGGLYARHERALDWF